MPIIALLLVVSLQVAAPAAAPPNVDAMFSAWTVATPGCSVGVDVADRVLIDKGFGMADLERSVPNRGDTIFEAGSVSKQFTAAALLLLARDGKLSLDDPIRQYLPEVPDYGTPITIRHLLTHTSGLRDWGSVAGIGGWPRTTRRYTHAHVLDILSRQRSLNFEPGTRWSYSNSGFNLGAILVAKVSGLPFAEFTRRRIFEPLGMSSTSWRDDHTRVVPRRALAYDREDDGYHLDLPFEDVHGNGGLLTTVGDLLKWTRNFRSPIVGDAALVAEQVTPGRFADGREHDYGLGVWVGTYRGAREIRHSGSTAGYRAYLTTFPELRTAVAVLCNAGDAPAEALAYKVADVVLDTSLEARAKPRASFALSAADRASLSGLYRDAKTGVPARIVAEGDGLRLERGAVLLPESATRLVTPAGMRWEFNGRGRASLTDRFGTASAMIKVEPWSPDAAELLGYEGTYEGGEAETAFVAAVDGGTLVLRQRPDRTIRLEPVYHGAFSGALGTVIFHRGEAGRVTAFSVSQDRVWDLRFTRQRSSVAP